jgi:uncharacterized membrane protein YkgB
VSPQQEQKIKQGDYYVAHVTPPSMRRLDAVKTCTDGIKFDSESGLLTKDLDYHLIRASMVIIFFFFGYQKWWEYEAQVVIPYISNGPLIFWLYDVFSVRGASWFLGVSEWIFGALLFLGFWNKKLGVLGAIGSCITFAGPSPLFRLCPMAGRRLQAAFRQ